MIQLNHCPEHVNRWEPVVFEFWKPPGAEAATATQPRAGRAMLPGLSMRIVESAGFVALVTAILYFMGYSYYAGYFERLALPSPFPELSTSDYFLQAFSSLSGLLVAVLLSIPYRSTVPATIPRSGSIARSSSSRSFWRSARVPTDSWSKVWRSFSPLLPSGRSSPVS
jgi:hypothetical protein